MNNERLTWEQIKEKYPQQNVGLVDVETGENSLSVKSAVVKYTSEETSYEELCMRAMAGEIVMIYTTMDEDDLLQVPTQLSFGYNIGEDDTSIDL